MGTIINEHVKTYVKIIAFIPKFQQKWMADITLVEVLLRKFPSNIPDLSTKTLNKVMKNTFEINNVVTSTKNKKNECTIHINQHWITSHEKKKRVYFYDLQREILH